MLELKNIKKSYGNLEIIHGVDLKVTEGEFIVFVGPSGCGKSTLLRTIAGLEDVNEGEVHIGGRDVTGTAAGDRGVAMVFQSYALYPHMTVRANLSFGLENIRMPRAEIEERVRATAEMLQIDSLLERRPKELSGGQRQRVAIGRAITRQPLIFLFDEPLSNLDAELRVQMRSELMRLHERLGNTMIYVTHDQVEAMTMADRIVVLRQGVIEQVGSPLELYNQPGNKFVASFIGSPKMNFLAGRAAAVTQRTVTFSADGLAPIVLPARGDGVQEGEELFLGVRSEDLRLGGDGPRWEGVVQMCEHHGNASFIHCNLPAGQSLLVQEQGQTRFRKGDRFSIGLPADRCFLFRQAGEQQVVPRLPIE